MSTTATENNRVGFADNRMSPFETAFEAPVWSRNTVRRIRSPSTTPSVPGYRTDGYVIALEERTFDEDEEPHHVIQDDVLGGEHDSHHQEDDGRDDRVQLEDGQGHDHEAARHSQAEEL